MKTTLAFSPCPNDTYMFNALATGLIRVPGCELDIHLHDIETLNENALVGKYHFTKISFFAYLKAASRYRLLDTGAALGYGCGPLVVAPQPLDVKALSTTRIALPGEMTTAHLLFSLWAPQAQNKVFVPYDRIIKMVADGRVDCGVIIHEGRFVFEEAGLLQIEDLGSWWEEKTELPIPLGGIVARKDLPESIVEEFNSALQASIHRAKTNSAEPLAFVRKHAQEMDEEVLQKHIETFVNEQSLGLDAKGFAAIDTLDKMAKEAGVI